MAIEPHLTEATITFTSAADTAKDADIALSVYVTTRVLNALNIMMANRAHFAESDQWSGSGKYPYRLDTTHVLLSELTSDIDIRLEWTSSTQASFGAFSYDLSLRFSDGSDMTSVLNHHVDDIILDQQNLCRSDSIALTTARASLEPLSRADQQ